MMKRIVSAMLSSLFLLTAIPFSAAPAQAAVPETLKILCIGNSFSCDTIEHVADIALNLGVKNVKLGNLYIGGCSIKKHYNNAVNNVAGYEYFVNTGSGWSSTYNNSMLSALESEDWDWVSIQHGTADGSRYAEEASYEKLPDLIAYIKDHVSTDTKIAFNMTWVGEKASHEELINSFNNDTVAYYNAIAALTRDHVVPTEGIDAVSPTGTAVQNARTAEVGILTRDNYHLSLDLGRYIAGLTFFKTLTGADISSLSWAPTGVTPYKKKVAIESANNACATPFAVTNSTVEVPELTWPDTAYGEGATPTNPYYAHAAKNAPYVPHTVDLLEYFNTDTTPPMISSTIYTANGLNVTVDLNKTPYLYYSFAIPEGSDFTFTMYSNTTYSPWLTFLDGSKGNAVLNSGAENWDAAFADNRAQYVTNSQSGCIDMRNYLTGTELTWIVNQLRFYKPKGGDVVVSYLFFGSAPAVKPVYRDAESLLPTASSQVSQVNGNAAFTINNDGTLTMSRAADSAIAWPSVRVNLNKTIDLSETPFLHLAMTTDGGFGNGFIYYTTDTGTSSRFQLSTAVKGLNEDFTENLDVYIDLTEVIGTKGTITLTHYTLSVYGVVGAEITWTALATAENIAGLQIIGDINGNGEVDTSDATALLRHLGGAKLLEGELLAVADCNGDSKVNTTDVRFILRQLVS